MSLGWILFLIATCTQSHAAPLRLLHLLLSSQLDSPDLRFETEFSDTFEAEVVPEEHLIRSKLRSLAAADQRKNIGPKHHFHDADAAVKL